MNDVLGTRVDLLCDQTTTTAGHIRSGAIKGYAAMLHEIEETTRRLALELGVIGLINIQYAVARGELYVIEANPRASRTIPFVSKAIGAPLAKVACRLMLGEKLADQEIPDLPTEHVSVKEAVLPFARFAGADAVLGPEMKSTGEVMGIDRDFAAAAERDDPGPTCDPASQLERRLQGLLTTLARRVPRRDV